MKSEATTIEAYLAEVPEQRQAAFLQLRQVIVDNLPAGFEETMSYGMIGYVVPHSIYPDGYHCSPELPLPFINIANQKNFVALYHSGIYASEELQQWFVSEYPKHCDNKLDMGKSCIRFKNVSKIPFELIAQLVSKMTVEQWITQYESGRNGTKKGN
ncbi:hypothetical protein A3K86_22280 [Photobacterium jeanii]|uniref:YdhG-like domain-containing protein n=1 Tax=Photobacterium jeanii TaxID=858640 RepID=A0A178K3G5_9GAMM|nr:DUF1801 domain-containing protein [Photobacterium jeanii]OAN11646.1 hypothetical protein A3K86_22280 [Photobacterium jeanii]PST91168.1 DUF1801 domain-containing protein [Photobacterium jeanii]